MSAVPDKDGIMPFSPMASWVDGAVKIELAAIQADLRAGKIGMNAEEHKQRVINARQKAIAEWRAKFPDE